MSESPPPSRFRAGLPDAALLSVALIWGINIPIMKDGMEASDPFWFNGIRMVISAAVLAALGLREFRSGIRPHSSVRARDIVTYAVVVSVLYQFLFLLGISQTTSGNTALIIATVPMWTAISARLILDERLRLLAWSGLCLAFTGTLIVTFRRSDLGTSREYLAGNLCILCAALSWTAGTIVSRPLLRKISPMQLSACSAMVGAPFHFLLAVPAILDVPEWTFDGSVWLALLYSGIFSTGLALPFWNFGVKNAGAAHSAIIQHLIPVIALSAAWLIRGEVVSWPQAIGGALIIGGLIVMRIGRSQPVAEPEDRPLPTNEPCPTAAAGD